jgi:hypothetical protein
MTQIRIAKLTLRLSEDGHDVFNLDHEQPIIALKIDGNGPFGIEQDLVVLAKRDVRRVLDFGGDGDDAAGDGGNFYVVRQLNAALGLFLILILADQHAFADRLDDFQRRRFGFLLFTHCPSVPAKYLLYKNTAGIVPIQREICNRLSTRARDVRPKPLCRQEFLEQRPLEVQAVLGLVEHDGAG